MADDNQSAQIQDFVLDGMTYDDFAKKDIIELLFLDKLPKERQDFFRKKIEEMVESRVGARIHDTLTAKERDEWEALLKAEKNEEVLDYLLKRGIDLVMWFADETIRLKIELYKDSKYVRSQALKVFEEEEQNASK